MGREYWDMFDVACGECELLEFLLTRFNAHDLKTKISISASCQVEEQFAPPPEVEDDLLAVPAAPAPEEPRLYPVADLHIKSEVEVAAPSLETFQAAETPTYASAMDQFQATPEEDQSEPEPHLDSPQKADPFADFLAARQRHLQQSEED
jgi:hypothetical protein